MVNTAEHSLQTVIKVRCARCSDRTLRDSHMGQMRGAFIAPTLPDQGVELAPQVMPFLAAPVCCPRRPVEPHRRRAVDARIGTRIRTWVAAPTPDPLTGT